MKKSLVILIIFSFALSCKTSNIIGFKNVKYTSKFLTSSKEKPFVKKTYIMSIPEGFKVEKEDFNPEYNEVLYSYKNDMKIYITDNTMAGSSLNGDNKLNEGITAIQRKNLQDSIYLSGQQKDGRYWKENILNDIVVGYLNVPKARKAELDKAISTLSKKGDKIAEVNLQHEAIHAKQ